MVGRTNHYHLPIGIGGQLATRSPTGVHQLPGYAWRLQDQISRRDGGIVIEPCQYCASERVAAVLDKRIEASPTAGNKYRKRCLSCSRWLPMCGAADFQTAEHQHVLPRGADPESEDPTVPAEEFDGDVDGVQTAPTEDSPDGPPPCQDPDCEEDATAASGHTWCDQHDGQDGQEVVTDGGEPVEEADDEEPDVNQFDCPECGVSVEGYPDNCPECGVPYNWED
ncbi:ORF 22 [Haloarcula hispanica virus SH1]|uniref:ORF 22 n=1 Tax=Haloarcula hispanica SH1 virus TaxID=326574 RepID=Q4KPG5_9VIRU|nr:ORF 22 [Haloarcula hispanica virus SH1]AAY24948.1 ORF 22 [Haloarcula hispanica virus SH1]